MGGAGTLAGASLGSCAGASGVAPTARAPPLVTLPAGRRHHVGWLPR
jgi:hypothetical protein